MVTTSLDDHGAESFSIARQAQDVRSGHEFFGRVRVRAEVQACEVAAAHVAYGLREAFLVGSDHQQADVSSAIGQGRKCTGEIHHAFVAAEPPHEEQDDVGHGDVQ